MKTYYERLKPSIKEVLLERKEDFPQVVGSIIEDLKNAYTHLHIKYVTYDYLKALVTISPDLKEHSTFSIHCFLEPLEF